MQGRVCSTCVRRDGVLRSDFLRVQPFHLSKGGLGDTGRETRTWLCVTQQVDSCLLVFKVPDKISAKSVTEDPLYVMICFSLAAFKVFLFVF